MNMETVMTYLSDLLAWGPAGGFLVMALGFVFLAAIALVFAVSPLIRANVIQRRLIWGASSSADGTGNVSLTFRDHEERWLKRFKPLYEPFMPKDHKALAEVRDRLAQAGFRNPSAIRIYFAIRVLLALGLGAAMVFVVPMVMGRLGPISVLLSALIAGGMGYVLPSFALDIIISRRQRKITEGFPDALDLLLVCIESGLSLDGAIARVGREIENAHPIIAEEFRLVGNELLAGQGRAEALRSFSERTGVQDVRNLSALLIQSDKLGTSIARALRVHAFEMRATRILRAEERAHKIPVKMAFPLMFGLIPVVLLVTVAPAVIRMVDVLFPLLSGTQLPIGK